jgi:hypothetical protein
MNSLRSFLTRLIWLYRAKPESLTLPSQFIIVLLCLFIGYLISVCASDSLQLASFLSHSFVWLFGIVLFTDLGGHFNDSKTHMTFWMNFMPSKLNYLFTLFCVFFSLAFLYSILSIYADFTMDLWIGRDIAHSKVFIQAIAHQTFGLTIVSMISLAIGSWLPSGLRQMICLSLTVTIFFLSSIIPYFFSFNDPVINIVFEFLPRIDLYDNRNPLFVALASYPWDYTLKILGYAVGQYLLWGTITWLKFYSEHWV